MQIKQLTLIASALNAALDDGRLGDVSVADAKAHVRAGDILDYLKEKLAGVVKLEPLSQKEQDELLGEWRGFADDVDERRKLGVHRSGAHLLLAYLIEGIQQRDRKRNKD